MKPAATTGFRHVLSAAGYSFAGLRAALRYESAFRQECALLLLLAPLGLWLGHTGVERALLLGSLLLILVIELINSAVETAIDRISSEHHALSGRAKDLGSAAVFVAIANAGLVWLCVLWDYL